MFEIIGKNGILPINNIAKIYSKNKVIINPENVNVKNRGVSKKNKLNLYNRFPIKGIFTIKSYIIE